MSGGRLVVTTTFHPGVMPFVEAWFASVRAQDDRDFDLWIGLDGVHPAKAVAACGFDPVAETSVRWLAAPEGATIGGVRQHTWERFDDDVERVVFVDADDVLHPSRVGAARRALATNDHVACALRLVDQAGEDLGTDFPAAFPAGPDHGLPRHNVFGLSNTAMRIDVLRRCLPIPAKAVAVDWYIATRAWLGGASLGVDPTVRMDYRQHDDNLTQVRGPFSPERVVGDTERVLEHFRLVLDAVRPDDDPERVEAVRAVAADVRAFRDRVVLAPDRLRAYVAALASLDTEFLWWSAVAHPALSHLWTSTTKGSPT